MDKMKSSEHLRKGVGPPLCVRGGRDVETKGCGRKETMNKQENLVAVLIPENPTCAPLQILEGDDLVGVNENDDVFKNFLVQEEICGPEVKRTKQTCGRFGAPIVQCISKLRAVPCQRMLWPFGKA